MTAIARQRALLHNLAVRLEDDMAFLRRVTS